MKKIKSIICVLIGHSRIESTFFGYHYCGRCGDQTGDSLVSIYSGEDSVIIGHNCDKCRENYSKMNWKHKLFVGNPFKNKIIPN